MNILKRDNSEVLFDKDKIVVAISKANKESINKVDDRIIGVIADDIEKNCLNLGRVVSVEEVQDMVEDALLHLGFHDVAKKYVKYRYARSLARKSNTTDAKILSLIRGINEEAKEENSNKDPIINSVQRDYLAGEVSRDITNRYFLTEEVKKAHEDGIIHFHDTDYFISSEFNCALVNLEDMLQNGTVISETLIEKPKTFSTACNIATQIIAQVASNQYGGQSISLTHLAPFVQITREKIRKDVEEELNPVRYELGESFDVLLDDIVERRVRAEIKKGVQTIQYQVITLMTTNG